MIPVYCSMPENQTWIILISRILLIALIGFAGYIALQPSYNTAHWTPNLQMRKLGFSYDFILGYEQHLNRVLHFTVSFLALRMSHFLMVALKQSKKENPTNRPNEPPTVPKIPPKS